MTSSYSAFSVSTVEMNGGTYSLALSDFVHMLKLGALEMILMGISFDSALPSHFL
jgi:hypothetical protein